MMRLAATIAFCVFLTGCAVPPRPGDPSLTGVAVGGEPFAAPEFRIHVLSVNGAEIPGEALRRSAATIRRHLNRPVRIIYHDPVRFTPEQLPRGADLATYPVFEEGRLVTGDQVRGHGPGPYLVRDRGDGFLGAVAAEEPGGSAHARPYIEPATVLVVVEPGTPEWVTGHTAAAAIAPEGWVRPAVVVLRDRAIARRSGLIVSRTRLYEWTLTHEMGHILGVPAAGEHSWMVPGIAGRHCTHPECVMYTGLDWRVVISGLLNGWPLDYCPACAAELERARSEAQDRAIGQGR